MTASPGSSLTAVGDVLWGLRAAPATLPSTPRGAAGAALRWEGGHRAGTVQPPGAQSHPLFPARFPHPLAGARALTSWEVCADLQV